MLVCANNVSPRIGASIRWSKVLTLKDSTCDDAASSSVRSFVRILTSETLSSMRNSRLAVKWTLNEQQLPAVVVVAVVAAYQ